MRRTRSVLVLAVITAAAAAGAMVVTRQQSSSIPHSGELLFPNLLAKVNQAERIEAKSANGTIVIENHKGRWVVPARHDYPASDDSVHQLLVGAAGLERIEPKTAKSKLYAKIGVEPPDAKGAKSIRYRVTGAGGSELFTLVVGRREAARSNPELSEFYVRTGFDPQAWLVQGRLPNARTVHDWLDQRISAIDRPRLHRVELSHADGDKLVVERPDPFTDDFHLDDVPAGMAVDGTWHLNDIGRFVEDLQLDDVRPAAGFDFAAKRDADMTVSTFDGLRIHIETAKDGKLVWARLSAAYDPSLVQAFDAAKGTNGDAKKKKQREDTLAKLEKKAAVEKEVKDLNARWQGWLFQLPDYKAEYLAKRKKDLLKAAAKSGGKKDETGKSG